MRRDDNRPKNMPRRFAYGVTMRKRRRKPFIVKFKRAKRTIYVGSYATEAEATIYANNFVLKELSS